jgi:hypothetical protein
MTAVTVHLTLLFPLIISEQPASRYPELNNLQA